MDEGDGIAELTLSLESDGVPRYREQGWAASSGRELVPLKRSYMGERGMSSSVRSFGRLTLTKTPTVEAALVEARAAEAKGKESGASSRLFERRESGASSRLFERRESGASNRLFERRESGASGRVFERKESVEDIPADASSVSDVSSSGWSSLSSRLSNNSFLRRSLQRLGRGEYRTGETEDFVMTFHSRFSIVKSLSVVKDILRSRGHRVTEEKGQETLKCIVPVKNQFKAMTVCISFIFDIGKTEISIYSWRPPRDPAHREAFVNFYKVVLIEMRGLGHGAVLR